MIPLLFKVIFQMESERREDKNLMLKDSELRGQGHGAQRSSNVMPEFISSSSHPGVAAVHVILKIGIVFLYLILPLVTSTFNTLFFIIILGAVDFWIVKNVAGRLLVGLRWWIDFNEDGEEHWKFECKVDEKENSGASDKAFWWYCKSPSVLPLLLGLLACSALWFINSNWWALAAPNCSTPSSGSTPAPWARCW